MKTLKLIGLAILILFKIANATDTLTVSKIKNQAAPQESELMEKFANDKKLKPIERFSEGGIKVKLGRILIAGDSLFFKMHISNRSNINYDIDFIRFYVRDLKTAKRTVSQELELNPIESFGYENKSVDSKSSSSYVFVLKKFAISKDKALFIEVYEKNGSRHLYLKVKQKDILRAKSILSIQ